MQKKRDQTGNLQKQSIFQLLTATSISQILIVY